MHLRGFRKNRNFQSVRNVFVFIISLFTFHFCACSPDLSQLKDGDIIFQTSASSQSKAIQLATHSTYSHCGIILSDSTGNLFVYEAVQPVQKTPLKDWVKRGEGKHFVVTRLKNANNILSKGILIKMKKIAERFIGKNYDEQFNWSDDEMYCSELVFKIYYYTTGLQLATPAQLKSFDLSSDEVKKKLEERYHGKIPMTELCVSPEQLLKSNLTEVVMTE